MSGGTLMVWLRVCSASIGVPAAIRPITGTATGRLPSSSVAGTLGVSVPSLYKHVDGLGTADVMERGLRDIIETEAPDLIVGYDVGYGASDQTTLGEVTEEVIADTLGALLKYQDDILKLRGSEAKRILDHARAELGPV